MDAWDIVIMGAAAYVAVVSLVRLMAIRRNEMLNEVRELLSKQLDRVPTDEDRDAA